VARGQPSRHGQAHLTIDLNRNGRRQSKLHEVGLERDGIWDSRLMALQKEGWPSPQANGGGNGVHEVQWRSGVQAVKPRQDWLYASGAGLRQKGRES
jgi:hypothetical protein